MGGPRPPALAMRHGKRPLARIPVARPPPTVPHGLCPDTGGSASRSGLRAPAAVTTVPSGCAGRDGASGLRTETCFQTDGTPACSGGRGLPSPWVSVSFFPQGRPRHTTGPRSRTPLWVETRRALWPGPGGGSVCSRAVFQQRVPGPCGSRRLRGRWGRDTPAAPPHAGCWASPTRRGTWRGCRWAWGSGPAWPPTPAWRTGSFRAPRSTERSCCKGGGRGVHSEAKRQAVCGRRGARGPWRPWARPPPWQV